MSKYLLFLIAISQTIAHEPHFLMAYVALPKIEYFNHQLNDQFLSPLQESNQESLKILFEESEEKKSLRNFKVYNLTFQNYPTYLADLFTLKLKGFEPYLNTHSPNWTIWTHPQICITKEVVTLELLTARMQHRATIGRIDLKDNEMIVTRAVEFCSTFIKTYTSAETPLFAYTQPNNPFFTQKEKYWTELDQLIATLIMRDLPPSIPREGNESSEIERRIGLFFQWRDHIIKFADTTPSLKKICSPQIGVEFIRHLEDVVKVDVHNDIPILSKLMTQRLFYQSLLLEASDPENTEYVDTVFTNLRHVGLFQSEQEQLAYRMRMFPRDND